MATIRPKTLGNGKRAFQVRWNDLSGRECSKQYATEAAAKEHKTRVEADMMRGSYVDPNAGKVTFQAYSDEWLSKQGQYAETTARRQEITLRRHIYPYIGSMPMRSIRRTDVQDMVSKWNRAVTRNYLATTSLIFSSAVMDGVIPVSPVLKISAARPVPKDLIIPTVNQVMGIANTVGPRFGALVMIAASTGLRRAELLAMTLESVDLDARTVRVRPDVGQVAWPKGAPSHLAPPKTATAARTVPIGSVAVDSIASLLRARPADPNDGFGGLLFRGRFGGPMSATSVGILRPAIRAAGFPVSTGLHLFRHFYASALIQAGESVKVVQKRLGHTSAVETLDTYGHLWPDSEESSRDAIDAAFAA